MNKTNVSINNYHRPTTNKINNVNNSTILILIFLCSKI